MGPSAKDTGSGGRRCADVRTFLTGHCTGHPTFCIGDMGGESSNWEGIEGFRHRVEKLTSGKQP